jgi:hypothetical protein
MPADHNVNTGRLIDCGSRAGLTHYYRSNAGANEGRRCIAALFNKSG